MWHASGNVTPAADAAPRNLCGTSQKSNLNTRLLPTSGLSELQLKTRYVRWWRIMSHSSSRCVALLRDW
ncbi:hypothetical protein E2C01_000421 [Portunus trituberculatus]|uniref:Uncharacterized protein n=1 Tax=Portunus trituberculatus TaxID=210409 RepID=A0A5B7CGJ9_PORTR|nr:hypothetical protein [Portunus trituberculatus]